MRTWFDEKRQLAKTSMGLSKSALESLGYKPLAPSESVKGTFTRIDVLVIQGITLNAAYLPPFEEEINGISFRIGIGDSLNEVCKQLVGEEFVDDEEHWKKETKSTPPFMLLLFGPTSEYVGSATHYKEHEGQIETYDSFSEARNELSKQSDAVVPSLLTSLSVTFSSSYERLVRFLPRECVVVGKSLDGKTIRDWRIDFKGTAFASMAVDKGQVTEKAIQSITKAKTLDKKIAKFYYLGSIEKDPLKRFLYFFLSLEVLVHSSFKEIDHRAAVSSLLSNHPHAKDSGQKLLETHRDSWQNLRHRFVWCIMHKWTHLTDADVQQFGRLKAVRDKISHGSLTEPDAATVREIEALMLRIQGSS
ncbi:hypothetical protein [Roseovarius sp.]|uniref:hypothetical protein n=1 Tax=Roseovarius sp. TaxID=1486281 RepID=UPI003BAB0851